MELFDPKPELNRRAGEVYATKVEMFQTGSEANKLLGCPFKFLRRGQCGMELSEVIPHLGSIADDLCLVRSMHSAHNNHTEALVMMNTGKIFPGRPALGSWVSYALGTENQNLPAYIVLRDPEGYNTSGTLLWQNGWIPALYRGTEVSTKGAPVLNLQPAVSISARAQRQNLDFLARLNEEHRQQYPDESELEARIRNYELAARMQLQAHEAMDVTRETKATLAKYGVGEPKTEYSRRPMPVDLALEKLLREYRRRLPCSLQESVWLFASKRTGMPSHPWSAQRRWLLRAGEKVGVGRLGWHAFRHTYSTLLNEHGTDVKVQQELLRHADIRTTMNIYTRAVPERLRKANSKLVRLLLPTGT